MYRIGTVHRMKGNPRIVICLGDGTGERCSCIVGGNLILCTYGEPLNLARQILLHEHQLIG